MLRRFLNLRSLIYFLLVLVGLVFIISTGLNIYFFLASTDEPSEALRLPLGYQAFEYPRTFGSLQLTGAIVEIAPGSGFEYVSHLSNCGLDESVLIPYEGVITLPSITRTVDISLNSDLKSGEVFENSSTSESDTEVEIRITNTKEEFLLTGDVVLNAVENIDELKARCGNFFGQPNIYWISHALVAQEIEVLYKKKYGSQLDISGTFEKTIRAHLGLESQGQLTEHGTIKYDHPIYIGFREAYSFELLEGKTFSFSGNEDANINQLGDYVFEQHHNVP